MPASTPRARPLAILIACVLLAAGCRGTVVDIMDATPRPTPLPTAPPVTLPTEELAGLYGEAVDDSNAAVAAAERTFRDRTELNEHLAYYAALADAEADFLAAVKAIPWPLELREDADRLIEASTLYESHLRFASEVRSMGTLSAASRRASRANEAVAAASTILRTALALPAPSA